jgi:1-deoxy-D-xylulose-5-phosphate reductoisomerase
MSKKKGVAILGSTGSIGIQAIESIAAYPDYFDVQILTAYRNADLLIQQALKLQPNTVVIVDESQYKKVSDALWDADIHVYAGTEAMSQVLDSGEVEFVLNAITGFAGIAPTIDAIRAKKQIALANKESLTVAGELVTKLAQENGVNIYPINSKQSSIFQCIVGEFHNKIEKIILTTQGGPFQNLDRGQLQDVSKKELLEYSKPFLNIKAGIDLASMMSAGFDIIEASWLFNLRPNQIELLTHKQSLIDGFVQFEDGSTKAQMALPDMKLPIQFALTYPERFKSDSRNFNFLDYPELSFEQPNPALLQNIELAFYALQKGGTTACVLNAANDVAVDAFLNHKISFSEISKLNNDIVRSAEIIKNPVYEDLLTTDQKTRQTVLNLL